MQQGKGHGGELPWAGADAEAAELLPLVYGELRELARQQLAREQPGLTLTATALVHEAYVRLEARGRRWKSPRHFFSAAARAMRRILIDRARRRATMKHGGGRQRFELGEVAIVTEAPPDELLRLDEAMTRLEARDRRMSEIVHLRYFAGLSVDQTADLLDISSRLVEKQWSFARALLQSELASA